MKRVLVGFVLTTLVGMSGLAGHWITPRAVAQTAAGTKGEAPIRAITGHYIHEQYAPPPETPMHGDRYNQEAKESWATVRSLFIKAGIRRLFQNIVQRIVPGRKSKPG